MFDSIAGQSQKLRIGQQNEILQRHNSIRNNIQEITNIYDNFWATYNKENLQNRNLTSILKKQLYWQGILNELPRRYRKPQPIILFISGNDSWHPGIHKYYIDYKNQRAFIYYNKTVFDFQNPTHRNYNPANPNPKELQNFNNMFEHFTGAYDPEQEKRELIKRLNDFLVEIYDQPINRN